MRTGAPRRASRRCGVRHRLADAVQELLELLAVLGGADRRHRRAQRAHPVPGQHAGVLQGDGEVEPRLAPQRGEQTVGPLAGDDPLQDGHGERLDVDGIGRRVVGHDRGRVAVHQHDADALLAEGTAGLGAGVVEFRRLADDDRAGADDQDAARPPRPDRDGPGHGDVGAEDGRTVSAHRGQGKELVEDLRPVLRAGRALRMVLDTDDWKVPVTQPLDAAIVQVPLAD